jgi:deferrochelatase/peroxidase EfeB
MMHRRQFLAGGAAAGAGAAIGRLLPGLGAPSATASTDPSPAGDPQGATALLETRIPFEGPHQAGILTDRPPQAIFAAFDAIAPTRADLADALVALSEHARRLTQGYRALIGAPSDGPTPDTGILGPQVPPDALTVTIGFGASLFDDRSGLAGRRPAGLTAMPVFPDDALVAAETAGDVLVQLCAGTQETLINALRELMRATRGSLAARWKVEGFLPAARESGAGRNLLGFKDGTSNPDPADAALMSKLVWDDDGGTYEVVRIIRNRVEFWDRVARQEQELMIGRDKVTGAPLGKPREVDDPDLAADPKGARIPLDSHIRLARPRTAPTEDERIVRRSYNYSRGIDLSGQLDMGLVFAAFNRDTERQFLPIQKRLAGEGLVDYVVPTGGGYFYLPPGADDGQDWVGSRFFA